MNNSKKRLIKSASELILLKGYKNTSITDILKNTQLSKGSFFHHFTDKKELFLNVIDYFYNEEITPLFATHFTTSNSPQVQIINFCTEINEAYQEQQFRGGCLLGNLALELSDIDEVFRSTLNEILLQWKKKLITVIKQTKTNKSPQEIADYIIWGIEGLTLTGKVHKSKQRNNSEFKMFISILKILFKS